MPSPELQSPFSCTWKPCSALGLRPVTFALTRTLPPCCVKVTVPAVEFPFVASRAATARCPSLPPPPVPVAIPAQPARTAPAAAMHHFPFMCALRSCCVRFGRNLRLLRRVLRRRLFVGLLAGLGRRRCRSSDRNRRRLRNGLPGLLHVRLVILHCAILGRGLVGLRLLRGGRILRLLLFRGGFGFLVGGRRGRELSPRVGAHEQDCANECRSLHRQPPVTGCAAPGTIFSGRLACFTSSYHIARCSM